MYQIIEFKDKKFNLTDMISESEYRIIEKNNDLLSKIMINVKYIDALKEEYKEYLSVIKDKKSTSIKIIRAINNYCSSYRAFLDKWGKYFKRENSKELDEYFKTTVKGVYDSCFEYRFIYNLRNYSQHVGDPVSRITRFVDIDTEVTIKVKTFVSSHSKMQAGFRKELQKIEIDEIDINVSIKIVQKQLEIIHEKLINKIIESTQRLLYSANYIKEFYSKYSKYDGKISIISQKSADEMIEISKRSNQFIYKPYLINHDLAFMILKKSILRFNFKGKYGGEGEKFPEVLKTKNALEIPVFYSGKQYVIYKDIEWTKILEITSLIGGNDYDEIFEVYMPSGLGEDVYKKVINFFEGERKE